MGLAGCTPDEPPRNPSASPIQARAETLAAVPRAVPVPVEAPPPPATPVVGVVLDVMQVVAKSEAEAAALLGQPVSCADIHRARLCTYGPDGDEVMFVRGKADMITVQGMDAVAFSAEALQALGLAAATPDHADEHTIRWESIPGLVEVAVFAGTDASVAYAYVKVGKH